MRLGGPAGRNPASARRRKDEGATPLADERDAVGLVDRSAEHAETEGFQAVQKRVAVADESELRDADELIRGELPGASVLLESVVGDQLADVAGRVVKVDGGGLPRVADEDGRAISVIEEVQTLLGPRE